MTRELTLSLLLVSCGGKADDTAGSDDTNAGEACGVTITGTVPADGAADFYYRDSVVFTLDAADATGPQVTLTQAGTDVPGTTAVSEDGLTVSFTPSEPLQASTAYTATLDYCTGAPSIDFTTSALGAPVTAMLDGNAFVVDLSTASWTEPNGVGDLIAASMTINVLIGVDSSDGGALEMTGALAVEGTSEQDMCLTTFPMSADFSESPYFLITTDAVDFTIGDYTVPLHGVQIDGTFAADGSYLGHSLFATTVDAREVIDLVPDMESWEDACELTGSLGAPCEACDDGVEACLPLRAEDITGTLDSGLSIVQVDEVGADCE